MRLLLHWLLSALTLLLVARFVPGFYVSGLGSALIAAVVIGLVNATLGLLLKIITFPLSVMTLGIFIFVINALMLKMASAVAPGFEVRGFGPAFVGAILIFILNTLWHWLLGKPERE
ncbi:MAG TPA: phage holin family protein [Terriglobales bacterium]|nr:phage holin family protein [Terriglobales bacterium]